MAFYNLAVKGKVHVVIEIVAAFEKATGEHIPYTIAPRRLGDITESYASTEKAECVHGWTA